MLLQASIALTEYTDPSRVAQGAVYPRIDKIRGASRHVAAAVIAQAHRDGVATRPVPQDIHALIDEQLWHPQFLPIRSARK